jgi:hypothetical protein
MKYDVIKSTDQLMGIWGLGNIKQGEEMKMTVLHPSDDPNHVHPFDCGYTVTGHIHNCDCKPNAEVGDGV